MPNSSENFEISNTTKGKLGSLPFLQIKNFVLGENYSLSLVFIDSKKSRELNRVHREKDKPANVLSFPLAENSGEIFIDLEESKRQAPNFNEKHDTFVGVLFIHGLLHLNGMPHGSKMERTERDIRARFGF